MRKLLIFLFMCVCCAGCSDMGPVLDPSASCDQVIPSALLSVPFDELAQGQEEATQWITKNFPTATFTLFQTTTPGDNGRYTVKLDEDNAFTIYLHSNSRYVYMPPLQPRATLGHIIRCFGEPEYYLFEESTRSGPEVSVALELWYPSQGIYIRRGSLRPFPITRYVLESVVDGTVRISSPGTMETFMRSVSGRSDEYIEEYLNSPRLKQWPENFTELTLED